MKSKGLIRFFTIAFIVVCLYQLFFSFMTYRVEEKARTETQGDPDLYRNYIDSIQNEEVLNFGLFGYTYKQVKEQQLNLGLDLQGGMNVILEVSVRDVLIALSGYSKDPTFNKAITIADDQMSDSQDSYLNLFISAYKELDPEENSLSKPFATLDNKGNIDYNQEDSKTVQFLEAETEGAIDRSFEIMRTRIDKFGVAQPSIQRQQGTGRIIIELPGVDNPKRVRKLLQSTAKLEFWETYENTEVIQSIVDANTALADKKKREARLNKGDLGSDDDEEEESLIGENLTVEPSIQDSTSLLTDLDSISNTTDSLSQEQNELDNPILNFLALNVFGEVGQQQAGTGPVIGYALPRDTAKVNAAFADETVRSTLPRDLKLAWTAKPPEGSERPVYQLIALKKTKNRDRAPLEGDVITDARETIDQYGEVEISMTMDQNGAKMWRKLTSENIQKSIAIVLDNLVYSFPTVQGEIPNGISSISGSFTQQEASDLANILKAGKLPAPARIIEEAVVGPSLGQEAISSGLISVIIGLLLVLFFMIFYYRKAGIVANIALIANIFFIFGILAALKAVLTLPGIAGIVLTIGMSVDANVLIYERIREELSLGKSMRNAISDGYKHAYSSIIDANVTTLLVGIILFSFGTGPIQGFATTLIIGICTSLFSAIFLTRMIFDNWLEKDKSISFYSEGTSKVFDKINMNFTAKRRTFYIISSVIIIAGIFSIFTQGFSLGVDFKGGRSYVVELVEGTNAGDLRKSLQENFDSTPEVKTFGSGGKYKITTSELIDDKSEEADGMVEQKLFDGVKPFLSDGSSIEEFRDNAILSIQKVGPTIVDDIKASAAKSIFIALIVISLYILIRFRKWQYSLGAAVALIHDVLFILSVFSICHSFMPFSMDIDQAFIAALLAIIGYSINDTVVVFDRLREYLGFKHNRGKKIEVVINDAVNGTLSRTIITAITTILVVLILFLFGGETIRGFSFALLLGMIVGTYSSIFIASSVVLDLQKRESDIVDDGIE